MKIHILIWGGDINTYCGRHLWADELSVKEDNLKDAECEVCISALKCLLEKKLKILRKIKKRTYNRSST